MAQRRDNRGSIIEKRIGVASVRETRRIKGLRYLLFEDEDEDEGPRRRKRLTANRQPQTGNRERLVHLYRGTFAIVGAALSGSFFSKCRDSQIPDLLIQFSESRF
jgi:hypothetical protein